MRNYKFDSDELFKFSCSLPYNNIREDLLALFNSLNCLKEKYNFPAINNDIGSFISVSLKLWKPKIIFEMGSGYGHSSFWYLLNHNDDLKKIYLTEKRNDLQDEFESLDWPLDWRKKLDYFQGDAFDRILQIKENIDLALIDGVKGDYLKFLKILEDKLSVNGVVLIDNSYWRGSFLNKELRLSKKSAKNIYDLHDYISKSDKWTATFIPYKDGLTVLTLS